MPTDINGDFDPTPRGRSDDPFADANDNGHGQNFDFFRNALDFETGRYADDKLASVNMPSSVANTGALGTAINSRMGAASRANPYDMNVGNSARAGYLAALDQLHNGTSVVGGQAAQAMGQLGSSVNRSTANTSSGLQQALGVGAGANGASDVAAQAGNARLSEFMNQQHQYAGGMNALREQDLGQAKDFQDSGLKARGQDDALHNFYGNKGADLISTNKDLALNKHKLQRRLDLDKQAKNQKTGTDTVQAIGTIIKMIAGA